MTKKQLSNMHFNKKDRPWYEYEYQTKISNLEELLKNQENMNGIINGYSFVTKGDCAVFVDFFFVNKLRDEYFHAVYIGTEDKYKDGSGVILLSKKDKSTIKKLTVEIIESLPTHRDKKLEQLISNRGYKRVLSSTAHLNKYLQDYNFEIINFFLENDDY